jgi:hypothetical protein
MRWRRFAVVFLFPILVFSGAFAQKADLALVAGGSFTSDTKQFFLSLGSLLYTTAILSRDGQNRPPILFSGRGRLSLAGSQSRISLPRVAGRCNSFAAGELKQFWRVWPPDHHFCHSFVLYKAIAKSSSIRRVVINQRLLDMEAQAGLCHVFG